MGCSYGIISLIGCVLVLTVASSDLATAEGYVGCLFNVDLCEIDEDCFDDNAFGNCQKRFSEDNYQHLLGSKAVKLLEGELTRLFSGGYRWKDEYTQCVVQNILYANRHSVSYDPGLCSRIMQMTIPEAPEILPNLQAGDPQQLALIKFTPTYEDENSFVYANEDFTPPKTQGSKDEIDTMVGTPYDQNRVKKFASELPLKSANIDAAMSDIDRDTLLRRLLEITRDTEQMLEQRGDFASRFPSDKILVLPTKLSSDLTQKPVFTEGGVEWIPADKESDEYKSSDEDISNEKRFDDAVLNEKNNGNDNRLSSEEIDDIMNGVENEGSNYENEGSNYENEDGPTIIQNTLSSNENSNPEDDIDDANFRFNWRRVNPMVEDLDNYFYQPEFPILDEKNRANIERREESDYFEDNLHAVLPTDAEEDEEDKAKTFQRSMRYDTKKPGPAYYFHDDEDGVSYEDETDNLPKAKKDFSEMIMMKGKEAENLLSQLMTSNHNKKQLQAVLDNTILTHKSTPSEEIQEEDGLKELIRMEFSPPSKTKPADQKNHIENDEDIGVKRTFVSQNDQSQPEFIENSNLGNKNLAKPDSKPDDKASNNDLYSVDSTRVYITLKEKPERIEVAEKLARTLEKLLSLPKRTFSDVKLNGNQVDFKVNQNMQFLNASDVAAKAEDLASEIQARTKLSVQSAGIGDTTTQYEVISLKQNKKLYTLTVVLCGTVVGVILAVTVAYIVQRHARSKKKLQNITKPDTEASQDYQDLCRQRMASKTTENTERCISESAAFSPKKVRTMSQTEGQASFSSHSSTSSWNEEPVTSNMDISTGHMILSYMEDHLKNKDRLDREWEALCAYEAEPCATTAATSSQNVKKNRYPDISPYDHSRVALNEVTNVSSSDYINASSITDHDPRNPAYIATQGPLPHTAADFWQMIWEQGSVVMVMLTRLMENGVAMCHRHWPEEGSEVYHIYEVHLVSEHIWCDDYLVRSFYLKNLKTGETRTVTQFHFLSWPDNGVPNSTKALLEFRRKVNKSYRGRSCPIVVHCSDGIGRTGTYILIDMVLNRMAKGAKEIDIAATLEHVRDQRGGMVKTKAQFEFVLMAIAEEVHAILRALSQ